MLNLKENKFLFLKKISPKSSYPVMISTITHLQDGNTKVTFMLRMLEKIYV